MAIIIESLHLIKALMFTQNRGRNGRNKQRPMLPEIRIQNEYVKQSQYKGAITLA